MDSKLAQHMLNELENPTKPLTKWEESFVMDMADRLSNGRMLSSGQTEKLQEIYDEKTA